MEPRNFKFSSRKNRFNLQVRSRLIRNVVLMKTADKLLSSSTAEPGRKTTGLGHLIINICFPLEKNVGHVSYTRGDPQTKVSILPRKSRLFPFLSPILKHNHRCSRRISFGVYAGKKSLSLTSFSVPDITRRRRETSTATG